MNNNIYVVKDTLSSGQVRANKYTQMEIDTNKKLRKLIHKGGFPNNGAKSRQVMICHNEYEANKIIREAYS